tara:strand:- start:171 stop:377 length:207 start_codon:yes stop_codon:yes gene_type:complete
MKLRSSEEKSESGIWTSQISEDKTLLIPQELLDELGWTTETHVYYSTAKGSLIIKSKSPFKESKTKNE